MTVQSSRLKRVLINTDKKHGSISFTDWLTGRSRDRIPMGVRFSAPVHTGPGAHPASYTIDTAFFPPGVKRPGRGVNYPHPSIAEVKERVDIYLCSSFRFSWPVLGRTLPFYLAYKCVFVTESVPQCLYYTYFKELTEHAVWTLCLVAYRTII